LSQWGWPVGSLSAVAFAPVAVVFGQADVVGAASRS
jgi:hypothetical protein